MKRRSYVKPDWKGCHHYRCFTRNWSGIAQRLGADGAKVIVNYGGSAEEAKAVVQSIQSAGGEAIALRADMTQN